MKKIIITLLLSLPIACFSQDISFEKVVTVDSSITSEKLFMLSEQWFAKNQLFVTKKIDSKNRDAGYMVAKTQYDFPLGMTHTLTKSIMKIDVKDGKARIRLSDFECRRYYSTYSDGMPKEDLTSRFNKKLLSKINDLSTAMINDFEKYIKDNSASTNF